MQQENIHIQKLKLEPLDIIIVKKKKKKVTLSIWVSKKNQNKTFFSFFK